MELSPIVVNDFGGAPIAEHNMPCAVCGCCHAVLYLNTGVFLPCWKCQKHGWRTVQVPKWLRFLLT